MSKLTREEINEMIEQMVTEKMKEFSSIMRDYRQKAMEDFTKTLCSEADKLTEEMFEKSYIDMEIEDMTRQATEQARKAVTDIKNGALKGAFTSDNEQYYDRLALVDDAVTPYEAFREFLLNVCKQYSKQDETVSAEVMVNFIYRKFMADFSTPLFIGAENVLSQGK